jgi:NAD(P)-dependent dehydrogenase (short-subunit alcohol dehydrogenase family)
MASTDNNQNSNKNDEVPETSNAAIENDEDGQSVVEKGKKALQSGIQKAKTQASVAKNAAEDTFETNIAPHLAVAREKASTTLHSAQDKASENLTAAKQKAAEGLTSAKENASRLKDNLATQAHEVKQTQMMHHYGAHYYTRPGKKPCQCTHQGRGSCHGLSQCQRGRQCRGAFGLAPLAPGERRVVVITGASAGMGYEAARLFAHHGWLVFAGARRVENIPHDDDIVAIKLDVTSSRSNHAFIKAALESERNTGHRIDVLINNAGYGEFGPVEEVSMPKIRKQFETNFFGAVELTQLVLPTMREQQSGRILNISSVVGNVYMPMGAYYDATKAAMQQWSDVLDLEVMQFGVRSVVVQPGSTQSEWGSIALENALANMHPESPYRPFAEAIQKQMILTGARATSEDLARVFYKAATSARVGLRYFYSLSDRVLVHIARSHPLIFKAGIAFVMKQLMSGKLQISE